MTELQPSLSGYRGQDEATGPPNGDQNIYRYNETVGYDSFNLVHNDRDAESPPPTPPVRDASSLKSVCYGPGHEKYPSWPSSKGSEEKSAACNVALGSHRSKSWTDHTNYPKEKLVQYTRPLTKRPTPTFTQQLKTVMEKCEKIPAESFESRKSYDNNSQHRDLRLWPRVDREGKSYGDAGYVVPSPPEREQHQPLQTLNHADFEAYIRNYPESQIDCYNGTSLTQEGLDEYTRVEHTQQPSYAQSEGYHSYVSSVDSTTTTPFLDRLRRDSEAVAHRPGLSTWEDLSHEGRDSVVTTSSGGSASSSETLKWHGSMSDVSVSSGLQVRRTETWSHTSISDVSSVDESMKKLPSTDCKCHSSTNRPNQPPKVLSSPGLSGIISQCAFANEVCQMPPKDLTTEERYFNRSETGSLTRSTSIRHSIREPKEDWTSDDVSDADQASLPVHSTSKQLIVHSSRVQTPQRHHSESILYLDKKRSHRKFPSPPSQNPLKSSPASQSHLSVSDRVDELERQQIRYTYLDPDKRHRVSDPTLKAIQKKALLSFYERHHQSSWRSEPHLVPGQLSQKSAPQPPFRAKVSSPRRASSASDYANSNWRNKSQVNKKTSPPELLTPKHKHSNSCGSLSTALLGPVIVGEAISIDDWVPERPPKKAHLRSFYSDRLPSPDLPPPSPPPVTDSEVFNCDEPLPPPPAELNDVVGECGKSGQFDEKVHVNGDNYLRRSNYERRMNSNDSGFSQASRQSDQGLMADYPNYRMMGRSSLRYPSSRVGEINSNKLGTKLSESLQYGITGSNHERVGAKGLLKSCSIRQVSKSIGRIDREMSITLGQKPQPQVSRNSSVVHNGQGKTNYSPVTDAQSYKFLGNNGKKTESSAGDERIGQKYDELSQYFPYYQQSNHYTTTVKCADATSASPMAHVQSSSLAPPPLAPRQNGTGVKAMPPPRPAPPVQMFVRKPSKTSYAVQNHERDPIDPRSYKTPPLPPAPSQDWSAYKKCDTPVLHQIPLHQHKNDTNHSMVQVVDQRINDRLTNDNDEIPWRLLNGSRRVSQKSTTQNNNNNNIIDTNNYHDKCLSRLGNLPDEPTNASRNYKTERSPLNGVGRAEEENNIEGRENGPVMATIESIESHRIGEKGRPEMGAGTANDLSFMDTLKTTKEHLRKTSPLSHRSHEHSGVDNNNDVTKKLQRSSPLESHAMVDYESEGERDLRGQSRVNNVESVGESVQNEGSSLAGRGNSWTRSGLCQSETSNSLRNSDESRSPLSTNLKLSEFSYSSVSSQCSDNHFSPCVSPQPGVEELRPLQRTEVVLRINGTLDAASQTEVINVDGGEGDVNSERVIPDVRKKLQEEIECEELSKNLADQLGPHDKLVPILVPAAEHKKSTDYVSGLFRVETTLQPRMKSSMLYSSGIDSELEEEHRYSNQITDGEGSSISGQSSRSSSIEYADLRQKKEELVHRLDRKIVVLRAEQDSVREEDATNEALGVKVTMRLSAVARPAEISKFRLHIEEVGKITSLLLGLSGRLARAENALHGMSADHPEKKILESKRDKLLDQLEEAKTLKINIDRRSANVSAILSKYLNDEEFADYQHFIHMKTKLIMDSRELQDKVKLGEEQLSALKEAIG